MKRPLSMFGLVCVLSSPATWSAQAAAQTPLLLLAQAGSTGGTVGNRDKSISGSQAPAEAPATRQRKAPSRRLASAPAPTACAAMIGKWAWANGGGDVEINSGGTLGRNGSRGAGTWSCHDGTIVLVWNEGGWVDKLSLSADGKSLSGNNQFGVPVSGTR
jgi:hypothetical protein